MLTTVNIEIALHKMHQLQYEGGDLGAQYWLDISRLLQSAVEYKARALDAEARLAKIAKLVDREAWSGVVA
jgi:hypothetical protein